MEKIYTVYWYKLKTHTNVEAEGYVGVTNNMHRRHLEHMRNVKNKKHTHFYNAVNKYGVKNIEYKVLYETTNEEEAYNIEYSYRPSNNIGWNSATGGTDTLKTAVSSPISLYHKDNYVQLHSFKSIADAALSLGISEGRIRQAKSRKTKTYGYDGWAILFNKNFDRSTNITIEELRRKINTGIKRTKPSHFKGKKRWSNEDKKRIGNQHRGKTIPQEQRDIISAKNRLNSPQCREVCLYHKDNKEKIYKFHSISEASRQLELPLSRLKSKAQRPLNRFGKDGWAIKYLGS